MAHCPLCSDILLHHIRSGQTYWFCRRCRVEMAEPNLDPYPAWVNSSHPELGKTVPPAKLPTRIDGQVSQVIPKL